MSRYYKSYDGYGEPITIVRMPADDLMTRRADERFERTAEACVNAEDLYETLRHDGKSHAEARAAVKERFGV